MDLSLWDGTSGVLESKARAGGENRGFPRDCAADLVTMQSKNVGALTRRVTRAFAGRLDRTSAHPQTAGEGRPSGAAPREVRRPDEAAYTSLWSFAGSPPAIGPVCMQVAVAAAGKLRDPVEIDQWSRSASPSTLPTANTVHCGAPAVSFQVAASGMPTPAHALCW